MVAKKINNLTLRSRLKITGRVKWYATHYVIIYYMLNVNVFDNKGMAKTSFSENAVFLVIVEVAMDCEDQVDSLEGWMVVKEGPFADHMNPPKFNFMVCWNDEKKKVAITCRPHSRVVSDKDNVDTRTGIFSFCELEAIHQLLCHVHPALGPHLPSLPEEPRSLWTYFGYEECNADYSLVCKQLEEYLCYALEICKEKLLMSTLFEYEEHTAEEYFENISELRRQGYEDEINKAEEELKNVTFLRTNASHMTEMKDVYKSEDNAVFKLNIALASLYNYLLQPFLDVRELAYSRVTEAREQLENPNVGARVKREYGEMFSEWQAHYEEALDNIQKYYIEYYRRTSDIYEGRNWKIIFRADRTQ